MPRQMRRCTDAGEKAIYEELDARCDRIDKAIGEARTLIGTLGMVVSGLKTQLDRIETQGRAVIIVGPIEEQ